MADANAKLLMIRFSGVDQFNIEGSKGMSDARTISLRYKHGKATGVSASRIIGEHSMFCLPTLLQSQTRIRHAIKPPIASKTQRIPFKTEIHQSPFTVRSYKSDINTNKTIPYEERTYSKPKSRCLKQGNYGQAKWRAKPSSISNQSNHPDPLSNASKQFLNRISELSLLQLETIKYENSKRKTKKYQAGQKATF